VDSRAKPGHNQWCKLSGVTRSVLIALVLSAAFCVGASANWFNQSEQYMAACEKEAARRYHHDTSSADVRRHIHLCMTGHGYKLRAACGEEGWAKPDCYQLKYKTEGR
jgi:hypothetical protein